jgi:hypothetical protein
VKCSKKTGQLEAPNSELIDWWIWTSDEWFEINQRTKRVVGDLTEDGRWALNQRVVLSVFEIPVLPRRLQTWRCSTRSMIG